MDYDSHYLPKRAYFSSPFLTLSFPHPDWPGDLAGDYNGNIADPLGGDLGDVRILRTSPLVAFADLCCVNWKLSK